MSDIVCVGILAADVILKPFKKIPDLGRLDLVDSIKLYTGGCATNSAIDLAKLGASVSIIGKVGNDGFGDYLKQELISNNVDITGLITDDCASTSSTVVMVDESGERTFLHSSDSNDRLEEIDYAAIKDVNIVFVAGSLLMKRFDGERTGDFLNECKQRNKITALDVAWDSTGKWMDTLRPCMPYIDYFLPSIEEAAMLSGKDKVEDMADVFFDLGVRSVVIKMGSSGCYVRENKNACGNKIKAFDNINVLDTTGAGDAFCAGFLFGINKGLSIYESAVLGNAVGAHAVMAVGSSTGVRDYDEIQRFIKLHYTK